MARDSYAFRISGIEPKGNAFRDAGEEVHRQYWRYIVDVALAVKDRSLAMGLDRHGDPMIPIAEGTRLHRRSAMGIADPDAPPLTPAHALSRTRSLLRGRAHADHAEFFWLADPDSHGPWGKILGYHRAGGSHLPIRDVIGLSVAELQEIQRAGDDWWHHFQNGQRVAAAVRTMELPAPAAGVPWSPVKFDIVGRTDLEHATFGIGGDRQRSERAIAEGYSSGFRKLPSLGTKAKDQPAPRPPRPQPVVANSGMPTPRSFKAHGADLDRRIAPSVSALAGRHGLTPAAYTVKAEQILGEVVNHASLYRRDAMSTMDKILESGRFKSQFETGTSRGALDIARRRSSEEATLGVPAQTPPEHRPIYGYFGRPGDAGLTDETSNVAAMYGEVIFRINDRVRTRTRTSFGDSFDSATETQTSPSFRPALRSLQGMTGNEPLDVVALRQTGTAGDVLDAIAQTNGYTEAQIIGGLDLHDVDEVIFRDPPSAEIQAGLRERGIPWRVDPAI